MIEITMLYDNISRHPDLTAGWGLSCLIEGAEKTILFDTGGDGQILLSNMERLEKDPLSVDTVVLSHVHGDHTGGLEDLLRAAGKVALYVPRSFPDRFIADATEMGYEVTAVDRPVAISDNVFSTGQMGGAIKEQALVLKTAGDLVVIMGCAHPGVVEMLKRAKQVGTGELYLALGGFHLMGYAEQDLRNVIQTLKGLGLKKIAPCHCTGDRSIDMFREAWQADSIPLGCGEHITLSGLDE
ncbi:MAG: MBL fold metallo-hydrolase [Deltaproteobacteria bacterium]|nr:MBL fold metallo-hydrolase [Deltaproteobacteria bacterium]